jgi:hypothetical protein
MFAKTVDIYCSQLTSAPKGTIRSRFYRIILAKLSAIMQNAKFNIGNFNLIYLDWVPAKIRPRIKQWLIATTSTGIEKFCVLRVWSISPSDDRDCYSWRSFPWYLIFEF